jgi:NADP-dependent aldehyde dehydrogenase
MTSVQPVLIAGKWRESKSSGTFQAVNPATRQPLPDSFPISTWEDCDAALDAAVEAFEVMRALPADRMAGFLEAYAERIDANADALAEIAHLETAYPKSPRLKDVELARTTDQLRQSAAAARDGSWALPTIDPKRNIRSCLAPIGPVCVFGPNNFPFAYGAGAGGDFAAAIAVGCPVIAKAHPAHPGSARLLASLAHEAAEACQMPPATIQLIYHTSYADGERLVSDHRIGAIGYTGGRTAGLKLKAAADKAGKPIFLELSSTNPVVILPGALNERFPDVVDQFCSSALMAMGQFCTNPGLVVLIAGNETDAFLKEVVARYEATPAGILLSGLVESGLEGSFKALQDSGAKLLTGGKVGGGTGYTSQNTALRVTGKQFLATPKQLQTEAFGNATLFVVAEDVNEVAAMLDALEGNLTGSIFSDTRGGDELVYERLAPRLRQHVGRMLNDKMPTGVAVTSAMNHGGPYPCTGHPGFTAVGVPAGMRRFVALQCYDHVREHRLPISLRNKNPTGKMWRLIDGEWSQADVSV